MAREAGSAAALAPVARALVDGGTAVSIVAPAEGAGPFERHALPLLAFPDSPTSDDVSALLRRENASVLVTGTSVFPDRDDVFWAAARALGVPSFGIVDHWCNYAARFSHRQAFDCLPDFVGVIDEAAGEALEAAGCPKPVIITGHPYFDELVRVGTAGLRVTGRRDLGIAPDRRVVVFASEPDSRHFGTSLHNGPYDDFTEDEVGLAVRRACASAAPDTLLIVKLHPLERSDAHRRLAELDAPPETRVLRSYPSADLISAADVVVGITSMFLLESALMGVPTISYRPGGRDTHFTWLHAGLIESVEDEAALPAALARAFGTSHTAPPSAHGFRRDAISRVVDIVTELAATDRESVS